MSTPLTRWFLPLGVVWAAFLLSAWVYSERLPPDFRTASPTLLGVFLVVPSVALFLLLLLRRLGPTPSRAGDLLVLWLMTFFFLVHAAVLAVALGMLRSLVAAVPLAVSVLLLGLGPVLGQLEPGSPLGIRTAQTLAHEAAWIRTHRVAAWAFAGAGLLGLGSLFFDRWLRFGFVVLPALAALVASLVAGLRADARDHGPKATES